MTPVQLGELHIHSRTDSQHATCIRIVCRAFRKSFCPLPPCTVPSQESFIASAGEREDLLHKVATLGQLTHLDCPKKHRAADVLQAARRIVKEAGLYISIVTWVACSRYIPFLVSSMPVPGWVQCRTSTRSTSGAVFDLLTKHLPRYNSKAWRAQGIG